VEIIAQNAAARRMGRAKKTRPSRGFFWETHHPLRGKAMGFGKTRKERTRFASTHPTN
jgi:hypothetical protein